MKADNHFSGADDVVVNTAYESSSDAEVMIKKSFSASNLRALVIDVAHADIVIETGMVKEATVRVELQSRNMSRAKERFEEMDWEVHDGNGSLYVSAESPRGNWNLSMDINVFITIPEKFDLDLKTSHGDVDLEKLNGMAVIATSHGDVNFQTIEGKNVEIRSSHGDITGQMLSSDTVTIETSHADIQMEEVQSKRMTASTSHSDISIRYLTGDSMISTSHGDITLFVAGKEQVDLETQHGNIDLKVDGAIGSDLDLRAESVRVDRSLSVKGETSRKRVDGAVNGGGRLIKARTTHGSIAIDTK